MPFSTACRLIAAVLFSLSVTLVSAQSQPIDTLRRIAEDEYRRLVDPALDTIPYERLEAARQQLKNRPAGQTKSAIPNVTWQERGPSNIAGRTRTLLFDLNDPTHKKVWAGSLSGGLWYTNDITDANATWTPVSDTWENTVITALAADPSNPQVMYAGTGDTYDGLAGGGIWKTANGGATWTRLTSSIPGGTYPGVNQGLLYIQRIVVNSTGKVFVATRYGVVQSSNGGSSWTYALAPGQLIGVGGLGGNYSNDNVTDLEIGSDGILYAGFNPSRVFKSNDATGTAWTEITPPGSTGGERTELALALSTSGANQVIYGVSHTYNSTNYGQDLRWFKKSINGGASWTDMAVPMYSSYFFTNGSGYYSLAMAVHPTDHNSVYAGGYNWYRSTDGGTTWSSPLLSDYVNQHLLLFQPGGIGAALSNNQGVYWSTDWANNPQPTPAVINRNSGYRTSSFYSVAMKATPGNPYLLGGNRGLGFVKVPNPNISTGSIVYNVGDGSSVFIDEDDPNTQILNAFSNYYLYNGNNLTYLDYTNGTSNNPTEYDSQSNTLYAFSYNNGGLIRKITGIGGTISSTNLSISGLTSTPSFFKLSPDKQSLFVGTSSGQIYKVTNLNQPTPNVTSLSNNTYLQNATISSIDVGVDDNELLVTYSNFGVKSVWYTSTNGNIWLSKDEAGHGLPDIPVRYAIFNPQNRLQVLLATELGVWSTTDITSSNPDWAPTNDGIGNYRINMLKYRLSDGRVAAATFGRGLYTTDAFALPYTLPSIAITGVSNATLCAGNTFNVSFTTSGQGFANNNKFDVWLSDANGNFANAQKIGSGLSSPVSATLPSGYNSLPYGVNYRVKIISTNPEVESNTSDALAIGNLAYVYAFDRRGQVSGTICFGSSARLTSSLTGYNGSIITAADSYQWFLNGSPIGGSTASTYTASQAGNYAVTVKQAGCTITSNQSYNLSINSFISPFISFPVGPQCSDNPATLNSGYIGEIASFQWKRDNVDISGATNYTYTTSQTGNYTVRVVDGSCNATAPSVNLQFGQSLFAYAYASDTLICSPSSGGVSIFSSIYDNYDRYSIQWYRNGTATTALNPLTSSNRAYYTTQPGIYSYLLKQGNCQTISNSINARVEPLKVNIVYYSSSKIACPGETLALYAYPSSDVFQWQKDGVDIPGATSNYFGATQSGNYTVRMTRGNCSAISSPVSLTFSNSIQAKVKFSTPTADGCSGVYLDAYDSYRLSGYQYQWYRNGVAFANTNSSFYAYQSGAYSVRITNGSCTGISREVYVNVGNNKMAKPVLSVAQTLTQMCTNNSTQLNVNFYYGTLQWKRNGVVIPFVTSGTFYATQSGIYTVVSQDNSCQAESDPVDVKIGEPTTATLSGSAVVSAGQSAQLPVTFTGPAPWAFTLTNGQSVSATYQNPYLISVAPATTTTYQLASVANACGTGATSGQANVVVGTGSADVSLNMVVSNKAPKIGDVVTYTIQANNAGPDNAQGVQLKSVLPPGLSFVSTSSPGASFANGIVSANLGTVAANSQSSVSFDATTTQAGAFATSAQITANQTPDPDSQPNSGTRDGQDDAATIDIRTAIESYLATSANPNQVPLPAVSGNQPATDANTADLSLLARVDKATPAFAELVTTTLTVRNRGGSAAASVVVQVVLPNGTFSSQSPAGWIQVNGQTYKAFINALPAGQSATLSLKWLPAGTGIIQAQLIDADVADSDSTPGNGYQNGEDDEASVSVKVR